MAAEGEVDCAFFRQLRMLKQHRFSSCETLQPFRVFYNLSKMTEVTTNCCQLIRLTKAYFLNVSKIFKITLLSKLITELILISTIHNENCWEMCNLFPREINTIPLDFSSRISSAKTPKAYWSMIVGGWGAQSSSFGAIP